MLPIKNTIFVFIALAILPVVLAFRQNQVSSAVSNNKWNLSIELSKIATGDTVVFSRDHDAGDLLFKSNGTLKQYTWYAYCGNTTKWERRRMQRDSWKPIGKWSITESNSKCNLLLELEQKDISLEQISQARDSIVFYVLSVQIGE